MGDEPLSEITKVVQNWKPALFIGFTGMILVVLGGIVLLLD
jgi:hypothetical protein